MLQASKDIKAKIEDRHADILAIENVIKEEEREPTAEETKAINAWYGTDDETDPGELAGLNNQLKNAKRREDAKAKLMENRIRPQIDQMQSGMASGDPQNRLVPAKAKRHGKLTAFSDEYDAYASGQWLRAVIGNNDSATEWCNANGIEIKAAMTEGVNTAGGFLVPTQFEASIVRLVEEYGIFRNKATNYPMSSDETSVPKRAGGLTVYYPNEASAITASDASVGRESLLARKMATLTRISTELSEDAIISITDFLSQEIATAFALAEDNQGFLGDGTSTYGGAVGLITAVAAGSTVTAATGNTAFSTLDDADFLSMMGKVAMYPGLAPEWYISPEGFYASMARLITASGGVGKADMEEDLRPRFHGRPVNMVNVMNKTLTAQTSTSGLCYYGDLRLGCLFGVRRGITIAADASVYFASDEVAIRATQRNAVNCHDCGTASAAGAVVMLDTPGS